MIVAGSAVDLSQSDGTAVVAETPEQIRMMIRNAIANSLARPEPDRVDALWIRLTTLADADEEQPRRAFWCRADHVCGLTELSAEYVDRIENEIS